MKRFIAAAWVLLGCARDSAREEQVEAEYAWDGPVTFAPSPQCPAPGTPQAASYQEHGGAHDALLWYMALHALSGPSYHETHHYHHYVPVPRYRPVVVRRVVAPARAPSWTTLRNSQPVAAPTKVQAPATTRPSPSVPLRTKTTAPIPVSGVRPSSSFGYKAPAARPTSTSFRSSMPTSRPSTPSRTR